MFILAMGYLNNFAATFFVSVTANLVYWWSTAALVLFSFQVDRERFFDFNASGIVHAVVVPLMVLLFWRFSMLLWPVGMGSVVGHVALALVVQMGYWQLVHHAFAAKISWEVLFFVGVCTLAIGCSGIWLPHVVAAVSCISVALGYQRFAKQQGTVALNGALSLAMGVSWAYSVFVLAMSTYAGVPVQGLFFCDCWKTMGVVMLADKLRGDLSHAASGSKDVGNQNQSLNLMLQRMVPQVLAAAYLSAVLWAFYLPMSGWILPVQVFATVLVTACPCVASLAVPLVNFFERLSRENMNAVFAQKKLQADSSVLERCVQRNIGIVKWYYFLSLSMACGGSYALWGIWMTPLSAGLMMLAGQVALMVHTSGFFLLHHLQSPRVLSGIEGDSGGPVDASSLGAAHAGHHAQQGQSARRSFDTSHDNPLALEQHTDTSSSYGDRVSSSQGVFHAGGDQNKADGRWFSGSL